MNLELYKCIFPLSLYSYAVRKILVYKILLENYHRAKKCNLLIYQIFASFRYMGFFVVAVSQVAS